MSDKTTQNLFRMAVVFPCCPLCSAEEGYQISGHHKNIVKCVSCKARWATPLEFADDNELTSMTLVKAGKNRKAKALLQKKKIVDFWRHLDIDTYDSGFEKEVDALLLKAWKSRRDDPAAYATAVEGLRDLGPLGHAEFLGMADGTLTGRKWLALWFLGIQGDERWVQILGEQLNDPDEAIRQGSIFGSIELCVSTGNDELIPKVIDRLRHDDSVMVRVGAAIALKDAGPDPRVIDALSNALYDTARPPMDPIVAGSIAGLILASARSKPKASVGTMAARSLAEIDDPRAAEILVKHELDLPGDVRQESRFIEAIGTRALKPLIEGLSSDNARHRSRAAALLIVMKDICAVDPLVEALAAKILVEHELDHPGGVRKETRFIKAIGPRALEPLIEGLSSDNSRHRARAAAFLIAVNDERAVESLIEALADEHFQVRRNAAAALSILGDERAVGPLERAAKDEDKRVGEIALDALKRIQGRQREE